MTMVDTPKVAVSADFLSCFAKIPKSQQKKVQEFISKFRQNPTSSAINYERIKNARSKNVVSVRIDYSYRGIVLKPDTGNVYMLMWVANHDDAYDWACRHDCTIHPSTGAIQVVDVSHIEAPDAAEHAIAETVAPAKPVAKIFAVYNAEQILALGVPQALVARVLDLEVVSGLEAMESLLPKEAYEPLYLLAAGEDYDLLLEEYNEAKDEQIDTEDFAAAIERPATKRSFHVVTDDLELQAMLNAPLEKWRVFLHPSQRKLVTREAKGPTRVLGGAGTGKTVVAMHRAKWLANELLKKEEGKVLFTTFTRNLAADIQANLKKLCTPEELARIEVINIDAWIGRLLKRYDYDFKVVYESDRRRKQCWDMAYTLAPVALTLPENFYEEEWRLVVQAKQVQNRQEYLKVSRVGRGTRLNRIDRAKIWPVFEEFRNQMSLQGLREINDAMFDGIELMNERPLALPYRHIVVDEGQDMGAPAFKLLRAIMPEQANDLFIVGDGHQRIYRNKVVLGQCGINIRGGRSKKLKINYRTTEETRRFAVSVLSGVIADNLDGETDKSSNYLSLFHGDSPVIEHFGQSGEEVDFVQQQIKGLLSDGVGTKDICVVARTNALRDFVGKGLGESGLETYALSADSSDNSNKDGVRLSTMHRIKGLEFQYLFIVSVNEGVVPLNRAFTEDPVERRDHEFNERALLHVAATRAIKGLYVTSYRSPSPFIA